MADSYYLTKQDLEIICDALEEKMINYEQTVYDVTKDPYYGDIKGLYLDLKAELDVLNEGKN